MNMQNTKCAGYQFHFDNVFTEGQASFGGIDLFQIGEICCECGYEISTHHQFCDELSCIVSGSGYFYINDTCIKVEAGDILFNSAGHRHAIKTDRTNMLRFVYMGFKFNDRADAEFTKIKAFLQSAPYHFSKDTHNLLIPFMRNIDEFYSKRPYSHIMIRNYFEEILVSAYRSFTQKTDKISHYIPEASPHSVGQTVYSVIRYIENRIFELESIKQLALDLNYNATYLSHVFKHKTGMTLQRYINHKKIEKALELLKYGNISIKQVADKLGYETIQSFSKAFSRIMGYPPSQYLAQHRELNH